LQHEVTIEPLVPAYFNGAARWLSDPDNNRWLYSEWRGRTVDERLLAIVAMSEKSRLYLVSYAGAAAGLVALSEINRIDCCAGVWYVLGERELGAKGVMTSAVALLVEVAFRTLHLHTLHASVMAGNAASERILQKNGFRCAGRLREGFAYDGRFVDRILYDIVDASR
jgi:ribosomal-protein-alanine N-acetyltransferase